MAADYRSSAAPSCKRCGAVVPSGEGFLSNAGEELCRICFLAGQQQMMNGRAEAALQQMALSSSGANSLVDANQDPRSFDPRARETRRCAACSSPTVTVVHMTMHFRGPLPLGRSYTHRCTACSREFATESPVRVAIEVTSAALLILIGNVVLLSTFWLTLIGIPGLALLARTVWRLLALVRNPKAE